MKTVEQWFEVPGQDLPVKLAEVLTPETGIHQYAKIKFSQPTIGIRYRCVRCKEQWDSKDLPHGSVPCPVPDPITIDWNTAMEVYRDVGPQRADTYLHQVWEMLIESPVDVNYMSYEMWKDEEAQPKHYLRAAAMAAERAKK